MRTTTKEFKTKVQTHTIERLQSIEEIEGIDTTNKTELQIQLLNVINGFNNWDNPTDRKRTPNLQKRFIEYFLCLPSDFSIEYEYYTISETMREWHEQTKEESNKYDIDKTVDKYYHLIMREMFTLFHKNKIYVYELTI